MPLLVRVVTERMGIGGFGIGATRAGRGKGGHRDFRMVGRVMSEIPKGGRVIVRTFRRMIPGVFVTGGMEVCQQGVMILGDPPPPMRIGIGRWAGGITVRGRWHPGSVVPLVGVGTMDRLPAGEDGLGAVMVMIRGMGVGGSGCMVLGNGFFLRG